MSYDAIVVGAGISGGATAYHLAKAGAKTLLAERSEPASGGTGKSAAIIRQSYSTPLLVRLARASITMLGNAKTELGQDAGFVQDGYCFVVNAEMLEGAKKNVAMQRSLGIVNDWSEGPGFPQPGYWMEWISSRPFFPLIMTGNSWISQQNTWEMMNAFNSLLMMAGTGLTSILICGLIIFLRTPGMASIS